MMSFFAGVRHHFLANVTSEVRLFCIDSPYYLLLCIVHFCSMLLCISSYVVVVLLEQGDLVKYDKFGFHVTFSNCLCNDLNRLYKLYRSLFWLITWNQVDKLPQVCMTIHKFYKYYLQRPTRLDTMNIC